MKNVTTCVDLAAVLVLLELVEPLQELLERYADLLHRDTAMTMQRRVQHYRELVDMKK